MSCRLQALITLWYLKITEILCSYQLHLINAQHLWNASLWLVNLGILCFSNNDAITDSLSRQLIFYIATINVASVTPHHFFSHEKQIQLNKLIIRVCSFIDLASSCVIMLLMWWSTPVVPLLKHLCDVGKIQKRWDKWSTLVQIALEDMWKHPNLIWKSMCRIFWMQH